MNQEYRNTERTSKPNPIRLNPRKQRLDLYWPTGLVKAIRLHCVEHATRPTAYVMSLVIADLKRHGHSVAEAGSEA